MMRILVCGDRDWRDEEAIWRILDQYLETHHPDDLLLIQGDAPGADTYAKMWAEERQIDHLSFPARWRLQHRAAGPIRNKRMLEVGKPDIVHAFHDDLPHSKGTADMVRIAKAAGVKIRKHRHKAKP